MGPVREIVVYVPAGGHWATVSIARGSAIVGEPRTATEEVEIYFEGAIFDQRNMRTLADRATHAAGRMLERYPTIARRVVPRDALVAVGTFDFRRGRISLAGSYSERAVAEWLGTLQLDPAELHPSQGAGGGHRGTAAARATDLAVTSIEPKLLRALMERGGVRSDGEEWVASDGRRTGVVGDALLWALENIAQEEG